MTEVLEDGDYDALVVDATELEGGAARVELTIVAGTHKGEVVTVRGDGLGDRALDLLGIPATITVLDGVPQVRFEP